MKRCKEAAKAIFGILKTVYELDRAILIFASLRALVDAATPFVGLLVSAAVVSGLEAGRDVSRILLVALAGVGGSFLLSLASGWIEKKNNIHKAACFQRYNLKVGDVTMAMDYPLLESPKTQEIRDRMQADSNWGSGIYSVFYQFEPMAEGFFSLIIALVILVPLVTGGAMGSGWAGAGYLLAVIALTALVLFVDQGKIRKRFYTLLAEMTGKTKSLFYFLFGAGIDYRGGKDVRVYKGRALIESWTRGVDDSLAKFNSTSSTLQGLSSGLKELHSGLMQGCAYLVVVLRALSGAIGLGDVVRYAGAIHRVSGAISRMVLNLGELLTTARWQRSTLEYLSIPHVLHQGTLPVEKRDDFDYALEFKNVSFRYPGQEDYALRNLNLTLRVGERMAVVGRNGSGKTTMIKLLCRLYEPTEGEITLNGIDIRKYSYEEYMTIFSVVFQDFKLFALPLGFNVAAGEELDRQRAERSLELVGFGERLAAMGLDRPLYKSYAEDGVEISGGEAQKVALARAIYKDAPFVILDEPTAALDPIAESEIYTHFGDIVGDKTAIFISHRLSSCRFCDNIAVFDGGRLVQQGSHNALVAEEGVYRRLWDAQAQYYA